ncbi:MAG: hypothetical protein EXR71_17465 [Myxococcales bacterium]|nr:hypothetical protein [Myxococcales bacterium]
MPAYGLPGTPQRRPKCKKIAAQRFGVEGITNAEGRQEIVVELYEKFFRKGSRGSRLLSLA